MLKKFRSGLFLLIQIIFSKINIMFTNSSLRNFQESTYRTSIMAITIVIIKMFILHDKNVSLNKTWLIVTLSKIAGFGFTPKETKE